MTSTPKLATRVAAIPALLLGVLAAITLAAPAGAQASVPAGPVSYINPDTDKPTANPDVNANSGCGDEEGEAPDKDDTQDVVVDPMTDNVHTDACVFDDAGARIDVAVAFQVSGVGTISACPDPDMMDVAGAEADDKTATLANGDTLCTLTGFEDANMEYHTRTISDVAGTQTITFCADPEGNGCDDADATSITTVNWTDAGLPVGGVDTGLAPVDDADGSTGPSTTTVVGFGLALALGGAAVASALATRRARS